MVKLVTALIQYRTSSPGRANVISFVLRRPTDSPRILRTVACDAGVTGDETGRNVNASAATATVHVSVHRTSLHRAGRLAASLFKMFPMERCCLMANHEKLYWHPVLCVVVTYQYALLAPCSLPETDTAVRAAREASFPPVLARIVSHDGCSKDHVPGNKYV